MKGKDYRETNMEAGEESRGCHHDQGEMMAVWTSGRVGVGQDKTGSKAGCGEGNQR